MSLTKRERAALGAAVALYEAELEDRRDEGEKVGRELAALDRAWSKVSTPPRRRPRDDGGTDFRTINR